MNISLEKNSQISFDIFEGLIDPIDLISIKQQGSFVPEKYIFNESVNLTITKFSGLFSKEEINSELFDKSICSFFISLLVDIFNKGKLVLCICIYYRKNKMQFNLKTYINLKIYKFSIYRKFIFTNFKNHY